MGTGSMAQFHRGVARNHSRVRSLIRRLLASAAVAASVALGGHLARLPADENGANLANSAGPSRRPSVERESTISPVDEALLRNLDSELLTDSDDTSGAATNGGRSAAANREGEDADHQSDRANEPDAVSSPFGDGQAEALDDASPDDKVDAEDRRSMGAEQDPLIRVGQRMRSAEHAMLKTRDKRSAERLHGEILKDLDQLIKQLDKQCQACQGGSCANPGDGQKTGQRGQPKQAASKKPSNQPNQGKTPALTNSERAGNAPGESLGADDVQSLLRDAWGNLPIREREQMLQSPPTRFLPKYELLIEQFFRRLAEEQQN